MAGRSRMELKQLEQFEKKWEKLYQAFPEARAKAVEAMGEAAFQELGRQISASDLQSGAKPHVRSWQEVRRGSKGGYAALSPRKGDKPMSGGRRQTWKGRNVTMLQGTRWLERGHGVRKPAPGSMRRWNRYTRAGLNVRTGTRFIKGRQFYSRTRSRATDIALDAADALLSRIAEEKG